MRDLFPVLNNDFAIPSVFDDFFNDGFFSRMPQMSMPKCDIEDTGTAYIMTTDLPGVNKEDISVTYDNDVLTIAAQHKEDQHDAQHQTSYVCRERMNTAFQRQFVIHNIDKSGIKAAFRNGVLKIGLPKLNPQTQEQSGTIDIQ